MAEQSNNTWDVFISHASEDKPAVAEPLAAQLREHGVRVWLDGIEIWLGDSLTSKISEGIGGSKHAVVVVSPAFLDKPWTTAELTTLLNLSTTSEIVLLPVIHGMEPDRYREEVRRRFALLLDRYTLSWDEDPDKVVDAILQRIGRGDAVGPAPTLGDVLDPDPWVALRAVDAMAGWDELPLDELVARLLGGTRANVLACRSLLGLHPAAASPLMIDPIRDAANAPGGVQWVASSFSRAHDAYASDELFEVAERSWHHDVTRPAVSALGFTASHRWAYELGRLLAEAHDPTSPHGGSQYAQIEASVVCALARMFGSAPDGGHHDFHRADIARTLDVLDQALDLVTHQRHPVTHAAEVAGAIGVCGPDQADLLLDRWLGDGREYRREVAALALGRSGLQRVQPRLLAVLADPEEAHAVRRAAAWAIGQIGGTDATDRLLARLSAESDQIVAGEIRSSVARRLDDLGPDSRLREVGERLITERPDTEAWVLRAFGRAGSTRTIPRLADALADSDHLVRATAALALARIDPDGESEALVRARHDAGTPIERVMTGLAVLRTKGAGPGVLADVRAELTRVGRELDPLLQADVCDELRAADDIDGRSLGEVWERVVASRRRFGV